jgi:hypothetical protein
MTKPKVYFASKLQHVEMLKIWRRNYSEEIEVTSRWLDMAHLEMGSDRNLSTDLYTWCWIIDVNDACRSDVAVVFGNKDDDLRGALVEAGIILGRGGLVFVIGDSPSFGTWQYHPQVLRVSTFNQAVKTILELHSEIQKRKPQS